MVVGVTARWPGAEPVPENGMVAAPALLCTVRALEYVPPAVGAKVTVTTTDCPGFKVDPAAGAPVTLNGACGGVTLVIVSVCAPTFVNVAPFDAELLTATLPKLMAGGSD